MTERSPLTPEDRAAIEHVRATWHLLYDTEAEAMYALGRVAERERCARICDDDARYYRDAPASKEELAMAVAADTLAAAIRQQESR
jgi:hypothetical protein